MTGTARQSREETLEDPITLPPTTTASAAHPHHERKRGWKMIPNAARRVKRPAIPRKALQKKTITDPRAAEIQMVEIMVILNRLPMHFPMYPHRLGRFQKFGRKKLDTPVIPAPTPGMLPLELFLRPHQQLRLQAIERIHSAAPVDQSMRR